jgi:hypothetical protein
MNLLILAALTGCAPDDATVKGDWFAWLASNSSATVAEDNLDLGDATRFECAQNLDKSRKRGWDAETCAFDRDYIGPGAKYQAGSPGPKKSAVGFKEGDNTIGGDCPRLNSEKNFDPDDGACDGAFLDSCNAEDMAGFDDECDKLHKAGDFTSNGIEFNDWITDDGYYGLAGDIQPWRSEALITAEGDLQLTVHIEIPGREIEDGPDKENQDFRFTFSIDPEFAPVDCLEDENQEAYIAFRDGSNWVDEWSEDEDGFRIFYLNSGAYQVNPSNSDNSWYLSDDMLSGFGIAKFAAEEAFARPTDYGHYDLEGVGPSFLAVEDHENPDLSGYDAKFAALCEQVGATCEGVEYDNDPDTLNWTDEMVEVMRAVKKVGKDDDGDPIYEPRFEYKVEKNDWRPIDSSISGLDGWMGVQSSWVRLEVGQTIAEGESVKGDFQVLFEGAEGGSRVLIRGDFKVDELGFDRWGYEILEDAKREENKTPYCNGSEMPK